METASARRIILRGGGASPCTREREGTATKAIGDEETAIRGGILVLLVALLVLVAGCGGAGQANATGDAYVPGSDAEETTAAVAPPVAVDAARRAAGAVDETVLRADLDRLTGVSPAPLPEGDVTIAERGSDGGRRAAARYLEASFERVGVPARIIEFSVDDKIGYNVEATLEGASAGTVEERHLWVTAHLDSVYNAGASDDASGLVSVLATARALAGLEDLEHTVHFVAYDLEEIGLVGSSRYVRDEVVGEVAGAQRGAVIGNLHSDMVGYDTGGFRAVLGTCNQGGEVRGAVLRAAEVIGSPLRVSDDCLRRSDHQHFWDAGLPAAILTDDTKYDGYPWYHKAGDTPDKLDLPYLHAMIRLTAASSAVLLADGEV